MAKARARTSPPPPQEDTTGKLGLVAGAGGLLAGGAGGATVTTCPPEDTSFYCKFVKGFNIFKMILFIVAILIGIVFIWYLFRSKK
jgi:hypothetical protein